MFAKKRQGLTTMICEASQPGRLMFLQLDEEQARNNFSCTMGVFGSCSDDVADGRCFLWK
jgi:hypothetical protein